MNEIVIVLIGFAIRIAIPILITALVLTGLRKLEAHWQEESSHEKKTIAEEIGEKAPHATENAAQHGVM